MEADEGHDADLWDTLWDLQQTIIDCGGHKQSYIREQQQRRLNLNRGHSRKLSRRATWRTSALAPAAGLRVL